MHLAFLTVAVAYRAFQRGKGLWIAAVLFGLLVLTHVFYAYMTAMAIGVLFLWGMNRSNVGSTGLDAGRGRRRRRGHQLLHVVAVPDPGRRG